MSKRRTPTTPASPEADKVLRDVMSSPEFTEALKARAIAGRITATEASLLRSLGVAVPVIDRDTEARENLGRIPKETRRVLCDLDRIALSPESTRLRVIRAGSIIGIGYDTNEVRIVSYQPPYAAPVDPGTPPTAPTVPPPTTDDESLLPPRTA